MTHFGEKIYTFQKHMEESAPNGIGREKREDMIQCIEACYLISYLEMCAGTVFPWQKWKRHDELR